MLAIIEPQDGQTLSVAAGATSFTISATIFGLMDVRPGDRLCSGSAAMIIRSVDPDSGDGVLLQGWPGPGLVGAADWYVEQSQASRQSAVASAEMVATANGWLARVLGQATPWTVRDRLSTPPANPADGDSYLASATAGSGFLPNVIYRRQDAAWVPIRPRIGDIVFVAASRELLGWDGTVWGQTAFSAAGGEIVGDVTLTGTGRRIRSDMTNAMIGSRLAFQSAVANGATSVVALPSGTSQNASFIASNKSDPNNSAVAQLVMSESVARVRSGVVGSATPAPLAFEAGGADLITLLPDKTIAFDPTTRSSLKSTLDLPNTSTVGRLARFSNSAGALVQSLVTEDASGNMTLAGRLSAPNQPGFVSTWLTGNISLGVDATSRYHDIVTWQPPLHNIGGGFDVGSGRFTAPVAGTYLFFAQLGLGGFNSGTDKTVVLMLRINGGTALSSNLTSSSSGWNDGLSCSAPLRLAAGDAVNVAINYSGTYATNLLIAQFNSHFGAQLLA